MGNATNVNQPQLAPLNNTPVIQPLSPTMGNIINNTPVNNIAVPLNQAMSIPQAQVMPNANNIQIQNQIPSNAVVVPSPVENVTPQIPITNNQVIPSSGVIPLPSLSTQEIPERTIIQQVPLNAGQTG